MKENGLHSCKGSSTFTKCGLLRVDVSLLEEVVTGDGFGVWHAMLLFQCQICSQITCTLLFPSRISPHLSHNDSFLHSWFLTLLHFLFFEREISDDKEQVNLVLMSLDLPHSKSCIYLRNKLQDFIFLYSWILLNTVSVSHFHYPAHSWWIFGCLHFPGVVNKATLTIKEEISVIWGMGFFMSRPRTQYIYECSWVMR